MSTFENRELQDMRRVTNAYADQLQGALYEQFKQAYMLVRSQNFRGGSADAFKAYIEAVAIHFINRILDLSNELKETCNTVAESFFEMERSDRGVVNDDTVLNIVPNALTTRRRRFDDLMFHVGGINRRARAYVDLLPLQEQNVDSDFRELRTRLNDIHTSMQQSDTRAEASVNQFKTKLNGMRSDMRRFLSEFYTGTRVDFTRIPLDGLDSKEWFNPVSGNVLLELWINDPFIYVSGYGAVWEDQWVAGNADAFVYLGMSALSGHAHFSLNDGVLSMGAGGSAFSLQGGFDSKFVSGQGTLNFLHLDGSAKVGWSDDYKGFNLSGKGAVLSGDGSITIGQGFLSLTGEGSLLSADAFATMEFESRNDFKIGLGAEANLATGTVGGGIFEVPTTNGGTTNLFGVGVSGSVGVGASGSISSVNVWSAGPASLNVVTVTGEVAAFLGLGVDLTIPVPSFNPFWWLW
ncbi:MAG: LXG domain-containing protein [Clostridia bacterium]|nr:LXG domain-containing protein [Clostridia bacterium]